MSDELNPHHPVTKSMHDQWHKVVALIMIHIGTRHLIIKEADVAALDGSNIVIQELQDGIHLRLVDDEEARRIAES